MRTNKIKLMKLNDGTTVYICEANKKEIRERHARMIAKYIVTNYQKEMEKRSIKKIFRKLESSWGG